MIKKCILYRNGHSGYSFVCGKYGTDECSKQESCNFHGGVINYVNKDFKENGLPPI